MTPSSRSEHSSERSITKVPYDVLVEIFTLCLPQRPPQIQQPNTTAAPMLLCQICSSWRMVALATPSLWLHLLYRITSSFDRERGISAFRRKDLDFMMWWNRNLGAMAPFSYLDIKTDGPDIRLARDDMDVILKCMASARYLRANALVWRYIRDKLAVGEQVVFPDPHTLMTDRQNPDFYHAQVLIALVPTHTSSALRRLFINGAVLPVDAVTPRHWSRLTHLATQEITISVTSWFSLIRALPDLVWASISFKFRDGYYYNDNDHADPSECGHPQLSTLFLTCCNFRTSNVAPPFSLLLTNLYLPALQTLSLSSSFVAWENHHALPELYAVLHSTPVVQTLALRGPRGCDKGFLSLYKPDYANILSTIRDREPVWHHAPQLTHLQLELPWIDSKPRAKAANILDIFVRNFFWPGSRWLALNNRAHPIRRVTFIAGHASSRYPDFDTVKDMMMESILDRTGGASDIVFEVVSDTEVDDAGSKAWKAWGS